MLCILNHDASRMDKKPPRNDAEPRFRLHPVYRLGMLLAAGGTVTGALATDAPDSAHAGHGPAGAIQLAQIGATEGEGEGEGEAGGEGTVMNSAAAYLAQLALIRGHLDVGVDLYREGHTEAAVTHMKHPGHELYAGLVPAFEARGVDGFADALETLATTVEEGGEREAVEAAYTAVREGITAAEAGVPAEERNDAIMQFRVIVRLMRTAAAEYAIAVVDGRMENAHEYQDALGFVRVARRMVDRLADDSEQTARGGVNDAIAVARTQLDEIRDLWVGLVPPDTLDREPARLYGATARVELAATAID